jgi:SAM-dependent methyltransferase
MLSDIVKRAIGPKWTIWARCAVRGMPLPRWGNLRRTTPFSRNFGADRGTPIDRYYLHSFLERHSATITGRVLEIQSSSYTARFGHDVEIAHSVDIDPRFQPTYVADLTTGAAEIPSGAYDCVLLPNTIQHLENVDVALRTVLRVVRPGGTILASAAGLLPLIDDGPDYWHNSPDGWRDLILRAWADCHVDVQGHGNCLAVVAAMMGIAVEELSQQELDVFDPRYPVLTTISCRKHAPASRA